MQHYRILNTDLDVSRIAYGTGSLGGAWTQEPVAEADVKHGVLMIRTAVEQGITLIDTADIYAWGKAEDVIGAALRETPGLRQQIVLQTKCGIFLSDEQKPEEPARFDFSYTHIMEAVEGSLRRMSTDYVDLLLLHRPDPLVEPDEVARAFDELHASGKVRYFGVSNHTGLQIDLLKRVVRQPLVVNQLELSLHHHAMISDGILANQARGDAYARSSGIVDYCRLHDMQIQAWSPLAGGALINPSPDAPARMQTTTQLIHQLATEHGTTPEAIALAWLLRHPAGIVPILGTQNPARLVDSCRADTVTLSRIEWYRLLQAARGEPVP
jgi:predicted oxidoreductase